MSKIQKIEELYIELAKINIERDKTIKDTEKWIQKRNEKNFEYKVFREKITELKNKRDQLNDEVKKLKNRRNEVKSEIQQKNVEKQSLQTKINELSSKKIENHQICQKNLEEIEWKIQTSSLSLQKEKELVDQVKQLEVQIIIHKKIKKYIKDLSKVYDKIKNLKNIENNCHNSLIQNADASKQSHDKMIKKIEELKKIKEEADTFHKLFIKTKDESKPTETVYLNITNQIKVLKEEIKKEEEEESNRKKNILKVKLEKKAKGKMVRGEKITLGEFQLLSEE